jgi:radical SAM superfamily enzyme YgiQ (UPF0313 family)
VPYGIALLAAIADRDGHQVQVFDANAWRLGDRGLREALEADSWDVVATGGITTTFGNVRDIVRRTKELVPRALMVVGGGLVTSMPREIMGLMPGIDLGVVGEGYVTFPEILHQVDTGGRAWPEVPGLAYRDGNGAVRLTLPRPLMNDIDSLPYLAWDMFPLDIYWKNSSLLYSEEAYTAKRRLDINASYGCSLICRFCFHLGITGDLQYVEGPQGTDVAFTYDRHIRWHSPRYIVDLAKHMHERFGVDFILFLDENMMTMNAHSGWRWLPEIAELWIKEGLQPQCRRENKPHTARGCKYGVHWGGTSHATLIKPELLKTLYDSGCSQLLYGLESFSDRVLKNLGKGTTAKTNEHALKATMAAGIRPIPNQIMGFPDEFFDSIRDSVHAWERLGIQVKPFFATPYPGSEWYYTYKDRILEQYGGDLEAFLLDLGDATEITAVISENFNAVELLGLRELMVNRDLKRINEYEEVWRRSHGTPVIPDFVRSDQRPIKIKRAAKPNGPVLAKPPAAGDD